MSEVNSLRDSIYLRNDFCQIMYLNFAFIWDLYIYTGSGH